MTKLTIIAALLVALASASSAQQRTLDRARGNVVGLTVTNTTTGYGPAGNVTGRASTSSGTTVVYDSAGRVVGRISRSRQGLKKFAPAPALLGVPASSFAN